MEAGGSMVGVGLGGLMVFLVAMDKATEMEREERESSFFYTI